MFIGRRERLGRKWILKSGPAVVREDAGAQQWASALHGEGTVIAKGSEGSLGMNMDKFVRWWIGRLWISQSQAFMFSANDNFHWHYYESKVVVSQETWREWSPFFISNMGQQLFPQASCHWIALKAGIKCKYVCHFFNF